jgi:hypothetical protein
MSAMTWTFTPRRIVAARGGGRRRRAHRSGLDGGAVLRYRLIHPLWSPSRLIAP